MMMMMMMMIENLMLLQLWMTYLQVVFFKMSFFARIN